MPITTVDVETLEEAINCCRNEHKNGDGITIPKELRQLADVYGSMIAHRQYTAFDVTGFAPETLETLTRWVRRVEN